jgi:hypothetical protein
LGTDWFDEIRSTIGRLAKLYTPEAIEKVEVYTSGFHTANNKRGLVFFPQGMTYKHGGGRELDRADEYREFYLPVATW